MSGKIGPENKFMHFVALSLVRSKAIILTLSVICVLLLPLCVVVLCLVPCADPEGEGAGVLDPPPLEISQKYRGFSNTGPDPLKNHKAAKPAFNVEPSSARQ